MENCCETNNIKSKKRTKDEKQCLINRLNRIEGQINGVKKMILEDRYCDDVLIQLSAINSSVKSLANVILDNHIHSCVVENVSKGNLDVLDEIVDLFKRFQ